MEGTATGVEAACPANSPRAVAAAPGKETHMAGPVNLKGSFDTYLRNAMITLTQFQSRLGIERTRPTVWSKQQADDLKLLFDGVSHIVNAVSELAAQVRDD